MLWETRKEKVGQTGPRERKSAKETFYPNVFERYSQARPNEAIQREIGGRTHENAIYIPNIALALRALSIGSFVSSKF